MFGSVFKMRPKSGQAEGIRKMMDEEAQKRGSIAGMKASYIFEETGGDMWGVAVFESEESYRKNADDPQQDQWYRRLREMLESDPEWHDGHVSAYFG